MRKPDEDGAFGSVRDFVHRSPLTWIVSFVIVYGGLFALLTALNKPFLASVTVAAALIVLVIKLIKLRNGRRS